MHFDALCLACIVHELRPLLVPGRIQQVVLAGPHALGLEIYAYGERRQLLLSAAPDDGRVHLVGEKVRRGVERETPLLLLLRKYVRDAVLLDLHQPDPAERLLTLDFRHKQHGATRLHVELLGRAANLILTRENGTILDCLQRVPEGEGVRRVLLPGKVYSPPPLGERISPLQAPAALAAALAPSVTMPGPLWKTVASRLAGMGPGQARETVRRAMAGLVASGAAEGSGNIDALRTAAGLPALAEAVAQLWQSVATGVWEPGVWLDDGRVIGYSPWCPTPGPDAPLHAARATLSLAIEEATAARQAAGTTETVWRSLPIDAYAAQRESVARSLRAARSRSLRALDALAADEPAPGAAEALRMQAEWLLALHTLLPPGATHLVLTPEQTGGPALEIPLDPRRSPVQQAEGAFRRAAKLERAATYIPTRRARLVNDLAFLTDLEGDLALAQNQPEIAAVRNALERSGLAASRTGQKGLAREGRGSGVGRPRRYMAEDGSVILVGRNARQNDHLTFEIAVSGDLWLHVRGAPGAHVVLQTHGRAPAEATLEVAARLAGYHSTLSGERAVDVIVAERRHVSRVAGGHPGQVTVRNEQTMRVPATLPEGMTESPWKDRPGG